jgi:hypothetical protein
MSCSRSIPFAGCLVVAAVCISTAEAATCTVPSAPHPTIQAAADDAACTEIVLGAQVYVESVDISRSVQLQGDSSATTVIEGRVTIAGASTLVTLHALKVDASALPVRGCFEVALDVAGGGRVTAEDDVLVVNTRVENCPIFADGLETGTTSRWSRTIP